MMSAPATIAKSVPKNNLRVVSETICTARIPACEPRITPGIVKSSIVVISWKIDSCPVKKRNVEWAATPPAALRTIRSIEVPFAMVVGIFSLSKKMYSAVSPRPLETSPMQKPPVLAVACKPKSTSLSLMSSIVGFLIKNLYTRYTDMRMIMIIIIVENKWLSSTPTIVAGTTHHTSD